MTTALEGKIWELLMREWDPIGVREEPAARDEYDDYVPQVARLIRSKEPPDKLAKYLLSVETVNMGLPGDADRARSVATRLAALQ